jgi:integrase
MPRQQQVQIEYNTDSEAYLNFISSIDSPVTKHFYRIWLAYFMKFLKSTNYDDLLRIEPRKIEGLIRDYIVYMREGKRLAHATMSSRIAAISHFLHMNDVQINWKKIKKYMGKHRSIVEDRPYQREEIKKLIDLAPLRDKAIICLLASSGMRRGALPRLRLRDIDRIDKYHLYKFTVYKNESESYITYCTPECTKIIDEYLQYRSSLGERLVPNTPLFRQIFDGVLQVNKPLPISDYSISLMISRLLKDSRVRQPPPAASIHTELMQTHGFRKFFKTTCINAGVNPLYSEYLMGHRSGLTKSYFKPTDQVLLEGNDKVLGYVAAINDLTINEEYRLHKKIDELTMKNDEIKTMEIRHAEEIKGMRDQMSQIISMIQHNPKLAHIKPEALAKKNVK